MLEKVRAGTNERMLGFPCRPLGLLLECKDQERPTAFFSEGAVSVSPCIFVNKGRYNVYHIIGYLYHSIACRSILVLCCIAIQCVEFYQVRIS